MGWWITPASPSWAGLALTSTASIPVGDRATRSTSASRDYQDHLTARIRFADPDEDDKRRHEEEARVDAEEQELAARRLFNEAYLQRMGRPQAFGLG